VKEAAKQESEEKQSKGQRIFSIVRSVLIYLSAILIVLFAVLFAEEKNKREEEAEPGKPDNQ